VVCRGFHSGVSRVRFPGAFPQMKSNRTIPNEIRNRHGERLFLHGLADDVVPPQDSRDLFGVVAEPKRLIEMPEADHVFSGPHAKAMASSVVAWMREMKL
jgi:fermentation-respiration switch protein FrsA (DUF1100 family)